MPSMHDLTGKKFNALSVVSYAGRKGRKNVPTWNCVCDCGNRSVVRSDNLKSGAVKTCGCARHKSPPNKTHGLRNHHLYGNWCNMKNRCYNPNVAAFKDYGGRGIYVCEPWKSDFKSFYDWAMANGWTENLVLDRIDNDGPYSPENCRIVTHQINSSNKRKYSCNTSGYSGVSFTKSHKKWKSYLSYGNEKFNIGYFTDICDAVHQRNFFICAFRFPHKIQPIQENS